MMSLVITMSSRSRDGPIGPRLFSVTQISGATSANVGESQVPPTVVSEMTREPSLKGQKEQRVSKTLRYKLLRQSIAIIASIGGLVASIMIVIGYINDFADFPSSIQKIREVIAPSVTTNEEGHFAQTSMRQSTPVDQTGRRVVVGRFFIEGSVAGDSSLASSLRDEAREQLEQNGFIVLETDRIREVIEQIEHHSRLDSAAIRQSRLDTLTRPGDDIIFGNIYVNTESRTTDAYDIKTTQHIVSARSHLRLVDIGTGQTTCTANGEAETQVLVTEFSNPSVPDTQRLVALDAARNSIDNLIKICK